MDFNVPEGSASDNSYLVKYSEDLWQALPEATKNHCIDTWTQKARAASCAFMVVMLIPDPMFPSGPNVRPYVHISMRVIASEPKPFKVLIIYAAILEDGTKWCDAAFQANLKRHVLTTLKDASGKIMLRVTDGQGQLLHESMLRAA